MDVKKSGRSFGKLRIKESGRAGEMIHRRLIMGNPLLLCSPKLFCEGEGGVGVGSFSCFGIYFGIPPSPIHRGLPPEGGLILEVLAELCFIIAS